MSSRAMTVCQAACCVCALLTVRAHRKALSVGFLVEEAGQILMLAMWYMCLTKAAPLSIPIR